MLKAFSIGYSSVAACDTYTFDAPFAIPEQAAYTTRTITVLPSIATVVSNVIFEFDYTLF
jgi:hypothetical protein